MCHPFSASASALSSAASLLPIPIRLRAGGLCSRLRKRLRPSKEYLLQEDGVGVIELVLILVVLIALVLIFKDRIRTLLESIFAQIDASASDVWTE